MIRNAIRRVLDAEGDPVFGSFIYLRDPVAVEVAASAGLDFVIIDTEHSARSPLNMEEMIRAAAASGVTALVRTGSSELAGLALDAGAHGIVVPHFGRRGDGRSPASWVRFPPRGRRGACRTVRATHYGRVSLREYADWADREVCLVGLIEDPEVIEELDEVLPTSGLDVVLPGPGDLAVALGRPGRLDDPGVIALVQRVADGVANFDAGPALAMMVSDPEQARDWYASGVRVFVCDIDESVLRTGYRGMRERFDAAWSSFRETNA